MFLNMWSKLLLQLYLMGNVAAQFDPKIYEAALDPELCTRQLLHITSDTMLWLKFLKSGMRIPKAIFHRNNLDMGDYEQCLGINESFDNFAIEGKYCMIKAPINENFSQLAEFINWAELDPKFLNEQYSNSIQQLDKSSSLVPGISKFISSIRMAVCIPKTCTTQEGITGLLTNITSLGFQFEEEFCRFKGDKLWTSADYFTIVLLSVLGFITILSTAYDVGHVFILKTDPKTISTRLRSFSVYTNGKLLTTFTSHPNNLNCIDGIRAISMFLIITIHSHHRLQPMYNYVYFKKWTLSLNAIWITSFMFAVDTFFCLSGILVVYTNFGKKTGVKLLKSLHIFYLHRYVRLFPLLATIILLQATVFYHIADGPNWNEVAKNTENCQTNWWTPLIYVNNYVGGDKMCLPHTWYLAVDMHCYIVSPLVLYWVLSGRKSYAWSALSAGILSALVACATYSFIYKFQGWFFAANHRPKARQHARYYVNTISRASPFFVGMLFGYLLSTWKGKMPKISHVTVILLWTLSMTTLLGLMYVTHLMIQPSWDTWLVDDLVNSFARPLWATAVGWIIFACHHGFGGPINWFLSLDMWKLPSRISYAMYLCHWPLQLIRQGTVLQPSYFSDAFFIGVIMLNIGIAYAVGFFMTLLIDIPFSVLFNFLSRKGATKPSRKEIRVGRSLKQHDVCSDIKL